MVRPPTLEVVEVDVVNFRGLELLKVERSDSASVVGSEHESVKIVMRSVSSIRMVLYMVSAILLDYRDRRA